jgi:hypothetical protein
MLEKAYRERKALTIVSSSDIWDDSVNWSTPPLVLDGLDK